MSCRYALIVPRSQDEKLRDLISATLECVDAEGTHGVRLRDVAERAGVSKAWILSAYSSRSSLVASAVGDRFSDRVRHSIDLLTMLSRELDSADAFIDAVATYRDRGEHVLERQEVWQFLEVLVWSANDAEVAAALVVPKTVLVDAFERLTAVLDDRGWLHADVGPISAAILLMASALARAFTGSDAVQSGGEESLLRTTLSALLRRDGMASAPSGNLVVLADSVEPEIPPAAADEIDVIREQILIAAEEELVERGVLGFRIQTVMDRAKVSASVLYRNFANRDEVVEYAAVRLATRNRLAVRAELASAPDSRLTTDVDSKREAVVAALEEVFDAVIAPRADSIAIGLTRLVQGRRVESPEQFERQKRDHFGSAMQLFSQRFEFLQDVDPQAYVEIGPLGFFLAVILINFPERRDLDVSVASAFLRVVESSLSIDW